MAVPPLLELRDVHAGYFTAGVLNGVDLTLERGEVHALLGRNGAGKTTLFRSICGLDQPTVTRGSIELAGTGLLGRPAHRIARMGVSLVPQGRRLFPSLTVRENLAIAARSSDGGWDEAKVFDLFPRLAERRAQLSGTLSGGEQQMCAIGRALITNPTVLLLDEPTEGLAPIVHDVILDTLERLKQTDLSVLLAEQNVDFAMSIADRISVLGDEGVIAWSGRPEVLRANPQMLHDLVGLGSVA